MSEEVDGGGELTHAPDRSVTRRMRGDFDKGQVDLIRATVAKELTNPGELAMFLEVCARHDFDPFVKEIWGYKLKGRVVIQASRDGLLANANRHTPEGKYKVKGNGQFLGIMADAVHEHDFFAKSIRVREDGTEQVVIDHQYLNEDGKPTHGGEDGALRGRMVGSWARVRKEGHDDTYFFAYRKEYDKGENVWKSHPHAMMVKVAESVTLRKAFSVSGVVGEGELPRPVQNLSEGSSETTGDIVWPEDEYLADGLRQRFEVLRYRRAKIRMLVNACSSDEEFSALLLRLDKEMDDAGVTLEGEITDAEVVDEPPVEAPAPEVA